jgi:carboxymethylenebutenolidase
MKRASMTIALLLGACTQSGSSTSAEGASEGTRASQSPTPAENTSATALESGLVDEGAFRKAHQLATEVAPEPRGEMVEVGGTKAYLSLPEGEGPHPGLVVIHEWWGLNRNIRYWSDRLAALGYAALAVDLYGGRVVSDPSEASTLMKNVKQEEANRIMKAARRFLVEDERTRSPKTGSIGWCFGGGQSLQLAIADPELDAAVMYYGFPVTDTRVLKAIEADLLAFFGGKDDFIPASQVQDFEKALAQADVDHEIRVYDSGTHAFANPSNSRYDEALAEKAFEKTRSFLAGALKGD